MPAPPPVLDSLRGFAREAAKQAHVPFSGAPEAAVLLLSDGAWVPGVRVENASFSLTLPPLINAYTTAVASERMDVVAAAVSRALRPEERVFLNALESIPEAGFEPVAPDVCIYADISSLPPVGRRLDPFLQMEPPASAADGIALARQVAERAWVPASHFPVGCVLETADGQLLPGANVEHPDWTRTLCAERNALGTAHSYGALPLRALYLSCPIAPSGSPCGACRQWLVELAPDAPLWMDRGADPPEETRPDDLLPGAFGGGGLDRRA